MELDVIHRPRRAAKDVQLGIVHDKRYSLKETCCRSGETLQDDVGEEEVGCLWEVLRQDGRDR